MESHPRAGITPVIYNSAGTSLGALKRNFPPVLPSPWAALPFFGVAAASSLQEWFLQFKRRCPNLFHNNSFPSTLKAPRVCIAVSWTHFLQQPLKHFPICREQQAQPWLSRLTQALQQTPALPVPVQFPKPSFPCKAIFPSYPSGLYICSKT